MSSPLRHENTADEKKNDVAQYCKNKTLGIQQGCWSSGMIFALGARGSRFDSGVAPFYSYSMVTVAMMLVGWWAVFHVSKLQHL